MLTIAYGNLCVLTNDYSKLNIRIQPQITRLKGDIKIWEDRIMPTVCLTLNQFHPSREF